MTHNTKGENPLDAPNIQEETNPRPFNGFGLYKNKRILDHIHFVMVMWCSKFGIEVFEGKTQ
jgi:hypothetical protein